jgi:ketosteroid isomerase-like protein
MVQASARASGRPRLWLAICLALVLASGLAASIRALLPTASFAQSADDLNAEGLAANQAWWGALVAGTPAAIGAVLAPEFQIMRADGTAYDKDAYLAGGIPVVKAVPEFTQMVGSRHGDLLVTRYYVTVNETRDGGTVQTHAPRLTVFRQEAGRWLVVAHANFATLDK